MDNIEAVTTTLGLTLSPAVASLSIDASGTVVKLGIWPNILADPARYGDHEISRQEVSRCIGLLPTMDQIRGLVDFYLSRVQKLCEPLPRASDVS